MDKQIWDLFWSNREKPLAGKILLFIRKKVLSKKFVEIALKNSKKGKILEAGSGTALSSILVGKNRGDEIYALDISPKALEQVKKFSKIYKKKVHLKRGDIRSMDFKDKEFDLCWNIGTIEHFQNPVQAIKEMKRVGKSVIVIVPANSIFWKVQQRLLTLFRLEEGVYMRLYHISGLKKIFKEAGFKKIKVMTVRSLGLPYIAAIGNDIS